MSYNVCLYQDDLAEAFQRFVRQVWPKDPSNEAASTSVDQIPHDSQAANQSPIFLFMKDQEVIGHIGTIPVRLRTRSGIRVAHWVVGFMVLPEYRNGPIGPLLIKKVNEILDCALTLHVEEGPLRIFKGLGWDHAGVLSQYVFLCDPFAVFKNIQFGQVFAFRREGAANAPLLAVMLSHPFVRGTLAVVSSIGLKLLSLVRGLGKPTGGSGVVTEDAGFDVNYDVFWEKVAHEYDALVVRDRSYLESRYGRRIKNYRILAYRRDCELSGFCILKVKQFSNDTRMGSMRIGTIVDCLFDPADVDGLQSLLTEAIRHFKKEAVGAVFCTASYAPLQKLLLANGFIKIPGNLNFACYDRSKSLQSHLSLASWHLMRGDSDADANF